MSIGELRSILNTSRLLKLGRYGMWNALDQVVNLGVQRLAIFPFARLTISSVLHFSPHGA